MYYFINYLDYVFLPGVCTNDQESDALPKRNSVICVVGSFLISHNKVLDNPESCFFFLHLLFFCFQKYLFHLFYIGLKRKLAWDYHYSAAHVINIFFFRKTMFCFGSIPPIILKSGTLNMYSVALLLIASASWKEETIIGCVLSVLFYHNVKICSMYCITLF